MRSMEKCVICEVNVVIEQIVLMILKFVRDHVLHVRTKPVLLNVVSQCVEMEL